MPSHAALEKQIAAGRLADRSTNFEKRLSRPFRAFSC
jgi:hypothetical protein